MPITVIHEGRAIPIDAAMDDEVVRITPDALSASLGWSVEAEGLCCGDVCIPVRGMLALATPEGIDLGGLAAALGRAFAFDAEARFGVLGAPLGERAARLASLEAPDFSLPDLEGRRHALSEHRGKKVLLVAWASW
jgi:hypothetical protein